MANHWPIKKRHAFVPYYSQTSTTTIKYYYCVRLEYSVQLYIYAYEYIYIYCSLVRNPLTSNAFILFCVTLFFSSLLLTAGTLSPNFLR